MNILITCCLGDHIRSNVADIKKAYPDSRIVGIDMRNMWYNHNSIDAFYQAPRCADSNYAPFVIDVCNKESIDVIVSFSSLDIEPFTANKDLFNQIGVKIALQLDNYAIIANNKERFYNTLAERKNRLIRLPITKTNVRNSSELLEFMDKEKIEKAVVKIPDSTGAKRT